eukprot:scaffold15547_cov40-Attheya_sp.AAC.1
MPSALTAFTTTCPDTLAAGRDDNADTDMDTPVDDNVTDANVHDTSDTNRTDAAPVTAAATGPVDDTGKGSSGEKETLDQKIDNGDGDDEGYNTAPESESPTDTKKTETESVSSSSALLTLTIQRKENRLYYPHCARCRKAKSEYPIVCDGKRPCNECTRKYLKRNKRSR